MASPFLFPKKNVLSTQEISGTWLVSCSPPPTGLKPNILHQDTIESVPRSSQVQLLVLHIDPKPATCCGRSSGRVETVRGEWEGFIRYVCKIHIYIHVTFSVVFRVDPKNHVYVCIRRWVNLSITTADRFLKLGHLKIEFPFTSSLQIGTVYHNSPGNVRLAHLGKRKVILATYLKSFPSWKKAPDLITGAGWQAIFRTPDRAQISSIGILPR